MCKFASFREETLRILRKHRIPAHPYLPLLDDSDFKKPEVVARRLIALYALAGLAHNVDPKELKAWLIAESLWDCVAPSERGFFDGRVFSEQEDVDLSWKQESLFTLCWSGGLTDTLDLPVGECDLTDIFPQIPPEVPCGHFVREFSLRDANAIWQQCDLYYSIHASHRHPELWEQDTYPDELRSEVIYERRRALDWLVNAQLNWDDVALDT